MIGNTKRLIDDAIISSDVEVARVTDVLFDDRTWLVRYFVIVLGFLDRTRILIPPHAVTRPDWTGKKLYVDISREQIEKSPPLDAHLPVSKLDEINHYRYYRWPYYWTGAGTFGIEGFPAPAETPPEPSEERLLNMTDANARELARSRSVHLRSCDSIYGYRLQTLNGVLGRVEDFILDDRGWRIRYVAINTGRWWHAKPVLVPVADVENISWDREEMTVNASKEKLIGAPYTEETTLGL